MSARIGLATAALAQLQGEEASQAEQMLIGLLPDARAVIGLGILRSRRAEPELTRMFEAEQRAQREAKLKTGLKTTLPAMNHGRPTNWSIWRSRSGESVPIGAGLTPSLAFWPLATIGSGRWLWKSSAASAIPLPYRR